MAICKYLVLSSVHIKWFAYDIDGLMRLVAWLAAGGGGLPLQFSSQKPVQILEFKWFMCGSHHICILIKNMSFSNAMLRCTIPIKPMILLALKMEIYVFYHSLNAIKRVAYMSCVHPNSHIHQNPKLQLITWLCVIRWSESYTVFLFHTYLVAAVCMVVVVVIVLPKQ